ncbi:MAG: acyl-CoA dehydrogenase family protein [Bacillus sp. (in: firmicutes)]
MREMIMETTIKILEKHATKEIVNAAESGIWPEALWSAFYENGLTAAGMPELLGGSGGDVADAFAILRLAGKYAAPIPLAETYIANWLLTSIGEQVTGEVVTVSSCTENLHFEKTESGLNVSGTVKDVPYARFAQKMLAYSAETAVLLDLSKAEIKQGQNLAGEARDAVSFHNVQMEGKLLPAQAEDLRKKQYYLGALTRTVMMAGALDRILELTVNYVKEREQFGKPLHRFQAVQHHLALIAGEVAAAGIAAEYAVAFYEKNPFPKEIALAKIRVNEAAGKASAIAHQVLAAIGFTHEHSLHHSTRRLWSWRDEYGTETDWEAVLTEILLQTKSSDLWSLLTGVENRTEKVEL